MLFAKNYITKKDYLYAKRKGATKFLFNETDFITPENTGEVFFNCNSQRVQSTWHTWEKNNELLEGFKGKVPEFFTLNGYDITLAIQKALFWSNFRTGFLWYSIEKYFPNERILYIEPLHGFNKINTFRRYLNTKFGKKKKQTKLIESTIHSKSYNGIHIKNDFQLGLYQNILKDVEELSVFKVFLDERVDKGLLDVFNTKQRISVPSELESYEIPKFNYLGLSTNDYYVLNIILLHWNEISENMNKALFLLNQNLKNLLVNEAENGIYGAIVSEVMDINGVRVFNTMNGIKAGEAQDAHINFHKWFVWDEQMRDLIVKRCNIAPENLIISGHLIEDFVKNYSYRNSLGLDREYLKTKKVISLFSIRGRRYVKLVALNYLYNLLKEDDSYFLIIRPHPSERPEDYILPEEGIANCHFVNYNTSNLNDTLHDQLLLSNISIVFGSTVALDSRWMNIPCISFERREESLIYCIDNEMLFHVKSKEELEEKIQFLINKKVDIKLFEKPEVSRKVINEILKEQDA